MNSEETPTEERKLLEAQAKELGIPLTNIETREFLALFTLDENEVEEPTGWEANLGELREFVAQFDDLPAETPVFGTSTRECNAGISIDRHRLRSDNELRAAIAEKTKSNYYKQERERERKLEQLEALKKELGVG